MGSEVMAGMGLAHFPKGPKTVAEKLHPDYLDLVSPTIVATVTIPKGGKFEGYRPFCNNGRSG